MEKTYIIPDVKIFQLQHTPALMAGSDTLNIDKTEPSKITDDTGAASRESGTGIWQDDEENN